MANPPLSRTSSLRRPSPVGAPSARLRPAARAAHGALAVAFLLALVSGGRWPWLHIPAGITVGLLAWTGLLGWVGATFGAGGPAGSRIFAGALAPWLTGGSAALLICLAGLSATGLGRWLTDAGVAASAAIHPATSWALAHEVFRIAALGLVALHLLGVVRTVSHRPRHPERVPQSARAEAGSAPRAPDE